MKHSLVFILGFLINYFGSATLKIIYPEQWVVVMGSLTNIINGTQPHLLNEAWLFIVPPMMYMAISSYCFFYWYSTTQKNLFKILFYGLFVITSLTWIYTIAKMISASIYAFFA